MPRLDDTLLQHLRPRHRPDRRSRVEQAARGHGNPKPNPNPNPNPKPHPHPKPNPSPNPNQAATERLLDAAALPEGAPRTNERPSHGLAYYTHYAMGIQPVFDAFRSATGAEPVIEWSDRLTTAQKTRH